MLLEGMAVVCKASFNKINIYDFKIMNLPLLLRIFKVEETKSFALYSFFLQSTLTEVVFIM